MEGQRASNGSSAWTPSGNRLMLGGFKSNAFLQCPGFCKWVSGTHGSGVDSILNSFYVNTALWKWKDDKNG